MTSQRTTACLFSPRNLDRRFRRIRMSRIRMSRVCRTCKIAAMDFPYRTALIVGTGPGISASLARRLAGIGVKVALASRDVAKLDALVHETGAHAFAADAADPASVAALFARAGDRMGDIEIVVYNAGARARGPIIDLDVLTVQN